MFNFSIEADYSNRSTLYSLTPSGFQTAYVESITSYVTRLAYEHVVPISVLMAKQLAPLLGKEFLLNSIKRGGNRFYDGARTLNGINENAASFSKVIEQLTMLNRFENLTMLKVQKLVPDRGLLKKTLSWCPICLREQGEAKKREALALPLIWYIDAVKVCSKHGVNLESKCSVCKSDVPILHRRSVNGFCPYCSNFLGYVEADANVSIKTLWIANEIENYIETIQTKSSLSISRELLINNLNKVIEVYTNGNIEACSKVVDIPKTTLWCWSKGEVLPPLNQMANLCYVFKIPVNSLYFEKNLYLSSNIQLSKGGNKKMVKRSQTFNHDKAKECLEKYLSVKQKVYISMTELAVKIGFNKRVLYMHFPELCKEVSYRYKCSIQQRKIQRQKDLIRKINHIVVQASQEGIDLTKKDIERILGIQGVFREQEIREHYKCLKENTFYEG